MTTGKGNIELQEFHWDLIPPTTDNFQEKDTTGSKIVVIGKPGSGKSYLLRDMIYSKKHIYPVGMAQSGTENDNHFYSTIFPDLFIWPELDRAAIENFIRRQQLVKQLLPNPWAILILDDCMEKSEEFRKPLYTRIFKNGRHWKSLFVIAMQYALDVPPAIRTCIDGVFIFRETILRNRKILYENYASIIPTKELFYKLMDEITNDHTALYISNNTTTNDWTKCVYWYKAREVPEFKFGCEDYWLFHNERYDESKKNLTQK
jgi:GTPase SAR1 family protein